uniref:RNA silencing suppressor n=1 Tax=Pitahaya virus E TaxID=3144105 RepID=A0AAU6WJ03_9VIRU
MQTMHKQEERRLLTIIQVCYAFGVCDINVCLKIFRLANIRNVGQGKSKYARRRRAKSIGRCERCYRVFPPICNSKCDNKTCVPGMFPNMAVVKFIEEGVTEVMPASSSY